MDLSQLLDVTSRFTFSSLSVMGGTTTDVEAQCPPHLLSLWGTGATMIIKL